MDKHGVCKRTVVCIGLQCMVFSGDSGLGEWER